MVSEVEGSNLSGHTTRTLTVDALYTREGGSTRKSLLVIAITLGLALAVGCTTPILDHLYDGSTLKVDGGYGESSGGEGYRSGKSSKKKKSKSRDYRYSDDRDAWWVGAGVEIHLGYQRPTPAPAKRAAPSPPPVDFGCPEDPLCPRK